MAISTTIVRGDFNRRLYGTENLKMASVTGIAIGSALTIAGDLVTSVTTILPNNCFKCKVTQMPRGKNRLIIKPGDTVTG
jgi:hypothetical protein